MLSRKAQLNCICDHAAKVRISIDGIEAVVLCKMFPLKPVSIFVDNQKRTSDTGDHIQFWAHRKLACNYFQDHKIQVQSSSTMLIGSQSTPHCMASPAYSNFGPQNTCWGWQAQ